MLSKLTVLGLTAAAAVSSAQLASADIVCVSKPNSFGGTVSVSIGQNEQGQPTVTLFAQGGMAHFVTSSGPNPATAQHEPDGTFYTFKDQFGQTGTVSVFTTAIGGSLQTTASSDFGLWKNSTMICK